MKERLFETPTKMEAVADRRYDDLNQQLRGETELEEKNKVLFEAFKEDLEKRGFLFSASFKPGEGLEFEELIFSRFVNRDDYKEWDDEVVWRGDYPYKLMALVFDGKDLELSSDHFNVATTFNVSLGYSGEMEGKKPAAFQMCIGFLSDHGNFDFSKEKEIVHEAQFDTQRDMLKFGGSIMPEDVKYVFVRAHGGAKGRVGDTYMFSKAKLKEPEDL